MTDPDGILAAIDAGVTDWVGADWTVSEDAMRQAPAQPHGPVPSISPALTEAWTAVGRQIGNVQAQLGAAFESFAKNVAGLAQRHHAALAPAVYGDGYRRHRRRCRVCNPAGNPKPLKVNGADYARRRKNRRRRQ